MSKLQLDISDFEHVKSDKDKTTLKSKKFGHSVTVAHNTLHPDTRKIFERLSQLGSDKENKAEGGQIKMRTTNDINGTRPEPGYTKMAHGGHPSMDEIEHGDPNSAGLPCLNPHCKSHGKPHPNCRCYSGGERFAEGGKVQTVCGKKIPHKPGCMYAKGGEVEDSMGSEQTPMEAAQITPEQVQKAQDMAMGTIGGVSKIAATPEALAPEIRDTAAKLSESMQNNGLGHQVTQTLAAKLKGLHSSLADAMQIQGFDEGGEVQHNSPGTMTGRAPFKDGGEVNENPFDGGMSHSVMKGLHALGDYISSGKGAFPGVAAKQPTVGPSQPDMSQAEAPQPGQPPPGIARDSVVPPPETPADAPASLGEATSQQPPSQPTQDDQQQPQQAPIASNGTGYNTPAFNPNTVANQAHQQAMQLDPQAQLTAQEKQKFAHDHLLWEEDLKDQHISPKTYKDLFDSKSTTGKIGTLFGLMIAGAGSGLTHQPNAVMEMMNKELERDFEAQKKSKDNAHNFLRLQQQSPLIQSQTNLNNAQKEQLAMQLGKAKGYGSMMHQLIQTRDQYPEGSPERQRADQSIQMLWPQYLEKSNSLLDGAAAISSMSGGGSNNPEAALDSQINGMMRSQDPKLMQQAQILQDARIPGVGITNDHRPVPPDKKDLVTGMNTLDYKSKDLRKFIDQHQGLNLSRWSPAVRKEGEGKLAELRNFYNNSIQGGALTALKNDTYDGLFGKGAPTDIWPQLMGSKAGLKEVENSNIGRRDILLKSLNIPIPKGQSYLPENMQQQSTQQGLTEGQVIVNKTTGQRMVMKNGKWAPYGQ